MQTAPANRGGAKEIIDDSGIDRFSTSRRCPQLKCECCTKSFPKRAGRRRRFCSDACRQASTLAQEARNSSDAECSVATGNALNRPDNSKGCGALSRHPHPSRFSVPLDLLGRGHRWPGAARLDRATRDKIAWREIGQAP